MRCLLCRTREQSSERCVCTYREVGIECQDVPGHSKGIGYRQGQSLKDVKSDHLWNAVLLGGQWFLLDACWGAGRVDMEHESFVKRLETTLVQKLCSKELYFEAANMLQHEGESPTSLLSPSVPPQVR